MAVRLSGARAGRHWRPSRRPSRAARQTGRKRWAKTDRLDARQLRELLAHDDLPEAWIPPAHIQELRTLVRLRKTLVDERRAWQQRIQAALFQHGYPREAKIRSDGGRRRLAALSLPEAALARVELALRTIERFERELAPLERELRSLGRRRPGCRALLAQHGIGALLDGQQRLSRCYPSFGSPNHDYVAGFRSVHRDKAGRPRAPSPQRPPPPNAQSSLR